MNTDNLQRATFVLDRPTAERLTVIAARMGLSRSQLVRDVLLEPIELMHRWVTALPDKPTQEQVQELMGQVESDVEGWLDSKAAQIDLLAGGVDGNA